MWFGVITLVITTHLIKSFKYNNYIKNNNVIRYYKNTSFYGKLDSVGGNDTEISEDSTSGENIESVDKLSPEFQRLLIGLIVYKSKYGNYNIPHRFVFGNDVDNRIVKYRLGQFYNYTIRELTILSEEPNKLNEIERPQGSIPLHELKIAHQYFRLIHLDISQIIKLKKESELKYHKLLIKPSYGRVITPKIDTSLSSDPNMIYDEFIKNYYDSSILEIARETAKDAEKILMQYYFDDQYRKNYNPIQPLPPPSDNPPIKENVVKSIVEELLQAYQETDSYSEQLRAGNALPCLVPSSTRRDREGGYHHEFFHWTFDDFIGALIHFNNLYRSYNLERYKESKLNGSEFAFLTFNKLERGYHVEESDFWPEKWHKMPLGHFIHSIRDGDIDAKDHWLRRPVLDRIRFDWGDGLRHLSFTWELLMKGIYWMINVRGDAAISPDLILPNDALVVRFGLPEEIQGLKIGYMFDMALQQSQVLLEHYPERYRFLEHSAFKHLPQRGIMMGYRPEPHYRYNPDIKGMDLSNTGKLFLGDHTKLSNFDKKQIESNEQSDEEQGDEEFNEVYNSNF